MLHARPWDAKLDGYGADEADISGPDDISADYAFLGSSGPTIEQRHAVDWIGAAHDAPVSSGGLGNAPKETELGARRGVRRIHVDTRGHSGYWPRFSESPGRSKPVR
ncbi:hypothetical protein [Streptomyces sp. NPDC093707]|uniref:hypothetical protein n=1 Tax=Streptomyces sp. NPDC093707 TaxID=3154984 RepID=UPI003450E7DB